MVLKEKYQTKLKIDDQIWTSKNKILHQIKNKNCLKPGSYYNNAHHEFSIKEYDLCKAITPMLIIKEYDLCKAITPMLIMNSASKNMIYVRVLHQCSSWVQQQRIWFM